MKRVTLTRSRRQGTVAARVGQEKFVGKNREIALSIDRDSYLPFAAEKNEKNKRVQLISDDAHDTDSILKLVEALPVKERRVILAKLALVAQRPEVEAIRDQDMWAQAVYSGLTAALGHGEGAGQGPMVVKRAIATPAAWTPVADFMRTSKLDTLKVVERRSVYDLLAKLVIEKAQWISRERGAPLSPKLVGNVSANIASIFDQAFPGYLVSGLALMVARRLTSGYRPGE